MKNKTLMMVLPAVLIPFIALAVVLLFVFSPQDKEALDPNNPNTSGGNVSADVSVESVSVTDDGRGLVLDVALSEFDSSQHSAEYELQDFNRKVVKKKIERSPSFTIDTDITSTGGFRLKVRLVDNKDARGDWSKTYTIDLGEGYTGNNKITANSLYFKTQWATGEGALQVDLKEAIEVAWGAVEANIMDQCVILNSGNVPPQMMLPPSPSLKPNGFVIKYQILEWDYVSHTGKVQYYWCV